MPNFAQYQEEVKADVAKTLKDLQCQPIIFVGSGFSRRYASAPSWEELLTELAARCPTIENGFAYYKQKYDNDLPKVGSVFAQHYFEWAWSKAGKTHFPAALYEGNIPKDAYIKYMVVKVLEKFGTAEATQELQDELLALKHLAPHAVITTNYDNLLEPLFPNYEVVVGQKIFRQSALVVGEVFKIHGSLSEPESMVFTKEDYDDFNCNKKYLSAKLLTYFAEHPLLFIGYSAGDPNIKSVLYDMSRMFSPATALIPNIYILQRDEEIDGNSYPAREHVLDVGEGIAVRIKSISSRSFKWVYDAFGVGGTMEKVNLKALRALAHRMMNLIRTDIPTKNVQVNYEALEHAISNEEAFANLFGVTNLNDPAAVNANHPYTSEMLAAELDLAHWTATNKLITQIKTETGFDMKASDNVYHVRIKIGKAESSRTRKYSDAAVAVLAKVRDGEPYEIPAHLLPAKPAA
ncbi:SIR2 family protein [Burkholderia ubonensis]|uniref:SIR2 family protein n=1 Tax=Burkholderia ubonensis TaxID=101571 RepID=UPI00075EA292|nr:SIR2 family protein [Burkholderia ubonensis]KVD67361.1 hypothetical protein WI86_19900 [Burkholderia ubonensis]KVU54098.1 hypothetical protein WK69_02530 [Burkholderia ubonensis]